MRTPPRILIADDNPMNLDILQTRLGVHGYEIVTATNGEDALALASTAQPDLILLDVMMPGIDGIEVCRRLRSDPALPFMPIILVTAKSSSQDVVAGLEAGGDEYLTKPVDQAALVARVKSMLRIKALHDTVRGLTVELADWNRTLEQRVTDQVAQLERLSRLKRFFTPRLAEMIVSGDMQDPLTLHRREVTVVFADLRGFTAFSETAEAEDVMEVLHDYHEEIGRLIVAHEGTVEHFAGDGVLIFFNDPVPLPNPAEHAVRMSLPMRDGVNRLIARWRKRGWDLEFGIGIAHGYATIGAIGFEERWHYAVIGSVANLAARLCSEAKPGQILLSQRVLAAVEDLVEVEAVGDLVLKGFHKPVATFNALGLKPTVWESRHDTRAEDPSRPGRP